MTLRMAVRILLNIGNSLFIKIKKPEKYEKKCEKSII